MKNTIDFAKKICTYFGARIGGSYMLVEHGLNEDLINDIDVIIHQKNSEMFPNSIRCFMNDHGWKENKLPITRPGYAAMEGGLEFTHPDYNLGIHFIKDVDHYSYYDIINEKFDRSLKSDIRQLASLVGNMEPKD